jgi:hypothetical protein
MFLYIQVVVVYTRLYLYFLVKHTYICLNATIHGIKSIPASLNPGACLGLPMSQVMVLYMFNTLRWKVSIRVVDIRGFVDHHCLNITFVIHFFYFFIFFYFYFCKIRFLSFRHESKKELVIDYYYGLIKWKKQQIWHRQSSRPISENLWKLLIHLH